MYFSLCSLNILFKIMQISALSMETFRQISGTGARIFQNFNQKHLPEIFQNWYFRVNITSKK